MSNNTKHRSNCSYLINNKTCNCGYFEFLSDSIIDDKYLATFYWEDNNVHEISRNNKKHLMSAAHRWMGNPFQAWDKVIIEKRVPTKNVEKYQQKMLKKENDGN